MIWLLSFRLIIASLPTTDTSKYTYTTNTLILTISLHYGASALYEQLDLEERSQLRQGQDSVGMSESDVTKRVRKLTKRVQASV